MELLAPAGAILALFLGPLAPARPKHEAIAIETTARAPAGIGKHSQWWKGYRDLCNEALPIDTAGQNELVYEISVS